jgi:hypothetical protein
MMTFMPCFTRITWQSNLVKFDCDNNIVATEEEAFGHKSDILVTRPDVIIMVDECGDNTSQKQNGNEGGQKKITTKNG